MTIYIHRVAVVIRCPLENLKISAGVPHGYGRKSVSGEQSKGSVVRWLMTVDNGE